MVRCEVISINELEPFLKFERLRRDLTIRLELFNELQELKLRKAKELSSIARNLKFISDKHKFKIDCDTAKVIRTFYKENVAI